MAELVARTPCAGLLPIAGGGVRVTEVDPGPMTAIAPFRGKEKTLAGALKRAHGVGWPAPGQSEASGDLRILWFGHSHALLTGVAPKPTLANHAALTDQGDAWAVVQVEGAGTRDVLARLTPLDLRDGAFPVGACARSEVQHMQAAILRVAGDAYRVMVFRSMARTLVHDLQVAMRGVAARG
ncbi:sarcosine oxidase subunit gamma [Lutimaribacter pacificus]|uniref:Sarcosine oxidase subunit gamma n=1 Tax=Lutimaribacter pacificus TaxID=391948 RepID=A0A1H0B922_9RHOB|nr:sarcosine oxidase subunit gamma family protein [Lutimaribacter pacificus]SDN42165.1 sarcosine oxidase subunit gamma [Lutimaribacter pacificus]SHJ58927.1 sarcosine oxidase subunit gamma [Lutimaribacter pacificus]